MTLSGNVFAAEFEGDLKGSVFADDSTLIVDAINNQIFADTAELGSVSVIGNVTAGNITTTGRVISTPAMLANLTAVAGARAFVNNANLAAAGNFGAQVGSGGSNVVPVWSDGSNWYIG